ncbi:hypothetical protein KWW45_11325 [Clostridioides difficile]|uniref:hypothetical protein n=1 Tax=Clostridioides difficile TaxID=1496 RepID=UPI002411BA10|nr:hypothetical protein [Clostridioides difficile]KAK2245350.1 hypothetical protein XC29_00500 [Clostridioides difficile]MBY1968784.1 hypothetical protein [Clostridioides difficile]HBF0312723.1 hypothetical protein [Clostridioides difficile]
MKSNKIYERKEYIIIKVRNGYIVYNTNKIFEEGHTHLKCYNAAKTAIDLAIKKKIPRSHSLYFLTSLIRISNDINYIKNINTIINTRNRKYPKEKYINFKNN